MLSLAIALLPLAAAVNTQTFKAPSVCPTCESDSYTGRSNGSLSTQPVVAGKGE